MTGLILVLLFSKIGLAKTEQIKCSASEYMVRGHDRVGYTKSDGTVVRPTTVITYCKERTPAYNFAENKFKTGKPEGWPHKETAAVWTDAKKEKVIEALEKLPDVLLDKNSERQR